MGLAEMGKLRIVLLVAALTLPLTAAWADDFPRTCDAPSIGAVGALVSLAMMFVLGIPLLAVAKSFAGAARIGAYALLLPIVLVALFGIFHGSSC